MVPADRSCSSPALLALCALTLFTACADRQAAPGSASPAGTPSPAASSSTLPSSSAPAPAQAGSAAAASATPSDRNVEPATRSAQAWLALVDAGAYEQSWTSASKLFRGAVTQANWAIMAARVRTPLGKVSTRQQSSSERKTSLPGAPDGQYVVLQFRTSFEQKADAIETVVLMAEDDGAFRVSGYFVR
jgi:hypothetical protein